MFLEVPKRILLRNRIMERGRTDNMYGMWNGISYGTEGMWNGG